MNTKQLMFLCVTGLISFYTNQSKALSCGDVITTNTTLTADLHCTTGWYALEIGADNITLSLNGHTLSGNNDLVGIQLHSRNKVIIKGNGGALKGFRTGISIVHSEMIHVWETLFYDMGIGLWVSSSNDTHIENNDFIYMESIGVHIANYEDGFSADSNNVIKNNFYKNHDAISMCGNTTTKNTISNNLIWKSERFGIHLKHSDENIIEYNDIIETNENAIQLDFSSHNQIISNTLKGGKNGLEINAYSWGGCQETRNTQSINNVYSGNHTFDFQVGIVLGNGHTKSSLVSGNFLNKNKIYNNQTGIIFNSEAHDNDARFNAYTGTVTPFVDSGIDNSY